MQNKKSQMGIIISVILAVITISIIILFLNNYKTNTNTLVDDNNCKNSLQISIVTQNNDVDECVMKTIKITNKLLRNTNVEYNLFLHENIQNDNNEKYFTEDQINSNWFKINKIIADEMVRIWEIVDEGKLNPFNKKISTEDNSIKYCLVSSSVFFDKKEFSNDNKIEIPLTLLKNPTDNQIQKNSFFYFLLNNNYKKTSDLSYFDFLTDIDTDLENYANVLLPILKEDKITSDKTYYIIYRKTYFKTSAFEDTVISALVGTMISSHLNGILNVVSKQATKIITATQAIKNTKEILLEKGFDNIILIDAESYDDNKYNNENICDLIVNLN